MENNMLSYLDIARNEVKDEKKISIFYHTNMRNINFNLYVLL
jgi:hypothetical protein